MNYEFYRKKLESALKQYAAQTGSLNFLPIVLELLPMIISFCNSNTDNKKSAFRIGQTILNAGEVKIIAPACPDYKRSDGRIVGMGNEISDLANRQLEFGKNLQSAGIPLSLVIAYQDQEVQYELIRRNNETDEELLEKINSSIVKTRLHTTKHGWQTCAMSELIPDTQQQLVKIRTEIEANPTWQNRLTTEALSRLNFYSTVTQDLTWDYAFSIAIRKAAFFLLLGLHAKQDNCLISDFTPTDNPWYKETDTGVLFLNSN